MAQTIRHSILSTALGVLRDKHSSTALFRTSLNRAGDILAAYALADLPVTARVVETPLETCRAESVLEGSIVLIPILRAGLSFVESFVRLAPDAVIGHLGLARDHVTLESRQYYEKLPSLTRKSVFILDPMLATGNSCLAAYQRLLEKGVSDCTVVSLVASPVGIALLEKEAPALKIISGSIDRGLNEHGYIIPGLGDAGDRYFGV